MKQFVVLTCFSTITIFAGSDIQKEKSIAPLSQLFKSIQGIRINQNGIAIPPLECLIDVNPQNYNYVFCDCTHKCSPEFKVINEPRTYAWTGDPNGMPLLKHRITKATITPSVTLVNVPSPAIEYRLETEHPDASLTLRCLVLTANHLQFKGCVINCNLSIIPDNVISPLFNSLITVKLRAQKLAGDNALQKLCAQLPHLAGLFISNTAFEDTDISLTHGNLQQCIVVGCGITDILTLNTPKLHLLDLRYNKLAAFDIDTVATNNCEVDLQNNDITVVHRTFKFEGQPAFYINARNNPLDKDKTYTGIFPTKSPREIAHNNLRCTRTRPLVEHDDFIVYENGDIELTEE